MDTYQVEKKKAVAAYNKADKSGKQLLTDLLGLKIEDPKNYVKTFGDVCEEAGFETIDFFVDNHWSAEKKAAMYLKRLMLIASVFNGDWVEDIADTSQHKYYPWFKIIPDLEAPGGFRLSLSGSGYGCDYSCLGVRPTFKDSETATYVGTQFLNEYQSWAQYQKISLNSK